MGRPQSPPPVPQVYTSVALGLRDLYQNKLLALEKDYKYNHFFAPALTDGDFDAKPMVLLVGQYSTGKTSFIHHLLERSYPGSRVGPEPTTDQFVAVMHGEDEQLIPGNAAVVDKSKPWTQLAEFGSAFLSRFSCATVNCDLLKGMTIVDSPGILSGDKHNTRGYDYERVTAWFAERADLIFLMFDAHKLDISDEFRRSIDALSGNDSKIRILLNKADMVDSQQLMRVYGALMWSLGKAIPTPEVSRVYIGSFWDNPLKNKDYRTLFEAEAGDLYSDIADMPKLSTMRKVNEFIKRCRTVKCLVLVLNYLKEQMPMLGKKSKKLALSKDLEKAVYPKVTMSSNVPMGDLPSGDMMRLRLPDVDLAKLPKLDPKRIKDVDQMLAEGIPTLMKLLPSEEKRNVEAAPMDGQVVNSTSSPFLVIGPSGGSVPLPHWALKKYLQSAPSVELYKQDFQNVGPDEAGLVTGDKIKADLVRTSGLPSAVLHRIWNLADMDKDGSLDLYEYCIARHFIDMKSEGFDLPHALPEDFLHALAKLKMRASL